MLIKHHQAFRGFAIARTTTTHHRQPFALVQTSCSSNHHRLFSNTSSSSEEKKKNIYDVPSNLLLDLRYGHPLAPPKVVKYVPGETLDMDAFELPLFSSLFQIAPRSEDPSERQSLKREKCGTIRLSRFVFGTDVRPDVMSRVVRWQRALWQQGTHKAKTRGEVRGGGRKPWSQKKTGKARQGSIRAPHWPGGGAVFGPVPRSHAHKMNIKERALGLRSALAARFQEKKVFVTKSVAFELDPILSPEPQSRYVELAMTKNKWNRPLFVDKDKMDPNALAAIRTLDKAKMVPSSGCTVYDVLKYHEVVFTEEGLREIEERLLRVASRRSFGLGPVKLTPEQILEARLYGRDKSLIRKLKAAESHEIASEDSKETPLIKQDHAQL